MEAQQVSLTKIIATISGRNCQVDFLKKLYHAGMNVVRLNTAHQDLQEALSIINNVRQISDKIAIMVDTKGPEIRTCDIQEKISLEKEELIYLTTQGHLPGKKCFSLSYQQILKDISLGTQLLIDDGSIALEVVDIQDHYAVLKALSTGAVANKKSVNIPSVPINLPAVSEKDKQFIQFAAEQNLDFIAHSFVRSKSDLDQVYAILGDKKDSIKIISKIEDQSGVDNIDEIIDHSFGIMVARGDLGIEIPGERIPALQKMIINKCRKKARRVIVATQMLHSMIHEPRPTRAEISDVANAIYDGTDALMLSGETAQGDYALESVSMMAKIINSTEQSLKDRFYEIAPVSNIHHQWDIQDAIENTVESYLCETVANTLETMPIQFSIVETLSGNSPGLISTYRTGKPIYAFTNDPKVVRFLSLSYGVYAYLMEKDSSYSTCALLENFLKEKKIKNTDIVLLLYGTPERKNSVEIMEINTVERIISSRK